MIILGCYDQLEKGSSAKKKKEWLSCECRAGQRIQERELRWSPSRCPMQCFGFEATVAPWTDHEGAAEYCKISETSS